MTKEAEIYSGEDSLFQENLESYIKINKIRMLLNIIYENKHITQKYSSICHLKPAEYVDHTLGKETHDVQ